MKKSNFTFNKDTTILFYFSGTGNTKLVANKIAKDLDIEIKSMEENLNFLDYIKEKETVIIMYPVYYSTPPIIVRDFIKKHEVCFENKQVMSIVSQMGFSGDGAYVLNEYLPPSSKLIYSRHINMPSNISNLPVIAYWEKIFCNLKINHALKKAKKISSEIKNNNLITQGNTKFGNKLGLSQRKGGLAKENKNRSSVWIDDSCIGCGICEESCPVNNFYIDNNKAESKGLCILCTRCENLCPEKSIRVFINKKVKHQYRLPKKFLKD